MDPSGIRSPVRVATLLAVAVTAAGCGDAGQDGALPRGADGAGSVRFDATPLPRARLVEELRLDAEAEDFSVVGPVLVGPSGQIAVPLRQDRQIRLYDEDGGRIAAVGRQGEGPGEFRQLGTAGWAGDTLVAYDRQNARLTWIGPDGALLRTQAFATPLPLAGHADATELALVSPSAVRPDGALLGTGSYLEALPDGGARISAFQVVAITPGDAARIIAEPPLASDDPRWSMYVVPGGFVRTVPFAVRPQMSFAPDGTRFANLYAEPTSAEGGLVTLSVLDGAGDTIFIRRYPFRGVPVSPSARDSAIAAQLPPPGSPPPLEGPTDLYEQFHAQARERAWPVHAPFTGFRLGLDGTVWIDLPPTEEGRVALVLDPDGEPAFRVALPDGTVIRQASATHLWVTEADAFGLNSVVRYRLEGLP